jgi:protein-S-isoprenylcysteine O-methyltransferase Ste14
MYEIAIFKIISAMFTVFFIFFGMDIRKKAGARDFVSPFWQFIMKFSSFLLIGAFIWIALLIQEIGLIDWLALMLAIFGTIFVTLARRTLGKAHTFTGQCLEKPELVTQGVYRFTRNPLYFGVFLCEIGSSMLVLHQIPTLFPQSYQYLLIGLATALLYAVTFNVKMAIREANYLESHFGDTYRQYRSSVPFLVPFFKLGEK